MYKRLVFALAFIALLSVYVTALPSMAQSPTPAATAAATDSGTAATSAATPQPFTRLNLNTSTSDQFLTISKVNARWVREFMEYRPYVSIQQYRKEIGKYVGDQQTAEWEKSLYVPIQVDSADAETLKQIPGVDDAIAKTLIAARPFGSNEAFLTKLATVLTPEQAIYCANYLDGQVTIPGALMASTAAPTASATAAGTDAATMTATSTN